MAKTRRAEVTVDAPVHQDDPIVEIEMLAPAALEPDPIAEGSDLIKELRANLRAKGVTGAAQDRAVAERWLARNR
jgi:hypothetical protein